MAPAPTMRRELLPCQGSTAISFRVGGQHAGTAGFLCVVDSCCKELPLGGLPHVGASTFLVLETARRGGREGPRPDTSRLSLFLCGCPQPPGPCSFQSPSESFMFHYLQMRKKIKKQIDKHGRISLFHKGLVTYLILQSVLCAPAE